MDHPNDVWTADFKGEFKTRKRRYCYPLTIQDGFSRYLLDCRALPRLDLRGTVSSFRQLFRTLGLPNRIRTDNGAPFATRALGRLSQLSVGWIELGIRPELIEPGKPYRNGRHERMHRTSGDRTAHATGPEPPCSTEAIRPVPNLLQHDASARKPRAGTPASLYEPRERPFPDKPEPLSYPGHFELRLVSPVGNSNGESASFTLAVCSHVSLSLSERSPTASPPSTSALFTVHRLDRLNAWGHARLRHRSPDGLV